MKLEGIFARRRLHGSSAYLERRLLSAFGSTAMILIVAAFSFAELSSVFASKRWVRHTLDVIAALYELQTTLLDTERGQRSFLVTQDPTELDSYRNGGARVQEQLHLLRGLTADNRAQQVHLDALDRDVAERLSSLGESLRLYRVEDPAAAAALMLAGGGKRAMAKARRGLAEMLDTEVQLLAVREADHERGLRSTAVVIGGGSLAAFVLGIVTNIGIRRGVVEREHSQDLIEEQARRLEAQTTVLTESERSLAQRLEELRIVNQSLDEKVDGLTVAKAEAERALGELRLASKALQQANRDLEQFAYVASHDLKAPLRGIASVSEWLEEELGPSLSDKSRTLLRLLQGRVLRMQALIDGIRAYSRASRLKDPLQLVEVGAIVRDALRLLSAPPGLVTIDVPASMPLLLVQKVPFEQIWMNLIGNALRHGAGEGAAVRVSARDSAEGWEFSVSDNGPGIAAQYHERIFRIFHTLASRDKVESTGMGLAIVKKLVDDRGGRVWVESEPGKGAKFCFIWPKS